VNSLPPIKCRVHLVGNNVNEVLLYSIDEDEVWEKRWTSAFRTLLRDAIKDEVDLDVIVIRGKIVEPTVAQRSSYTI